MSDRYLSAAQMREADRRCIEELGIPGAVLMNNAGAAVFERISHGPVGIVCGKGNNGGDGYVVARLALLANMDVRIVIVAPPDAVAGDARIFLEAYLRLGGSVKWVQGEEETREALEGLSRCAVLVDALLGTGIQGEVRGDARVAIEAWPELPTIAVDLPSGLNADTGEVCGVCIRATETVSFQFGKAGFKNSAAEEFLGNLSIVNIGIPNVCADDADWERLKHVQSNG